MQLWLKEGEVGRSWTPKAQWSAWKVDSPYAVMVWKIFCCLNCWNITCLLWLTAVTTQWQCLCSPLYTTADTWTGSGSWWIPLTWMSFSHLLNHLHYSKVADVLVPDIWGHIQWSCEALKGESQLIRLSDEQNSWLLTLKSDSTTAVSLCAHSCSF